MRDRGGRVGRSPVATAVWAVGRGNKEKSDGAQRRGYNQSPITDHPRASLQSSSTRHVSIGRWAFSASVIAEDAALFPASIV